MASLPESHHARPWRLRPREFLTCRAPAPGDGTQIPTTTSERCLHSGILAHGSARAGRPAKVGGEDCGHERLIALACKNRGEPAVLRYCGAQLRPTQHTLLLGAGAERTACLTDHVLADLHARRWVLSLFKRLGPFLHHDPGISGATKTDGK